MRVIEDDSSEITFESATEENDCKLIVSTKDTIIILNYDRETLEDLRDQVNEQLRIINLLEDVEEYTFQLLIGSMFPNHIKPQLEEIIRKEFDATEIEVSSLPGYTMFNTKRPKHIVSKKMQEICKDLGLEYDA